MDKSQEIKQIKEVKNQCPVCECPVCPPKRKPWQAALKCLAFLVAGLLLAFLILAASGLRIARKESLLDIWLASRKGITPTPEITAPTPTPDPTADWKTYINKEYGFEFRYPPDWEVRDILKGSAKVDREETFVYLGFAPVDLEEDILGSFWIIDATMAKATADIKSERLSSGSSVKLVSENNIDFNNKKAVELIFENTLAGVKSRIIIIAEEDVTYVLEASEGGVSAVGVQILSTFRFFKFYPKSSE